MTELKPCPFCGSEDLDVHVAAYFGRLHEDVTITCNDCIGSIYGSTEERAVEAWNTRHVETCSYVGDDISGGCSECRGWLDPACAYCPSCGRKVEG